jgi:hypothetical protein
MEYLLRKAVDSKWKQFQGEAMWAGKTIEMGMPKSAKLT